MIKTAIAVFLCFCVDLLRNGSGIVVNAAVAAVLCMQPSVSDSKEVGWNRVIGTFIGGIAGAIFVAIESLFLPLDWLFLHYVLVALAIIPVIYITVYFRRTATSQLSCVIFLIIAVVRDTDMNPILYSVNRMLDTFIGIAVSIIVNVVGFYIVKHIKTQDVKEESEDQMIEEEQENKV